MCDPATTQCVARRAIEYATGQPPQKDSDTLTSVNQSFADSGYRIRALFQRVATMPASMQRSPPQTAMLNTR